MCVSMIARLFTHVPEIHSVVTFLNDQEQSDNFRTILRSKPYFLLPGVLYCYHMCEVPRSEYVLMRDKPLMRCTVQMCHCTLSLIRRKDRWEGIEGKKSEKENSSKMEQESDRRSWCTAATFLFASSHFLPSESQRHQLRWYSVPTLPPLILHCINYVPAQFRHFCFWIHSSPYSANSFWNNLSFGLVTWSAQQRPFLIMAP